MFANNHTYTQFKWSFLASILASFRAHVNIVSVLTYVLTHTHTHTHTHTPMHTVQHLLQSIVICIILPFSALTPLVGRQEGHQACISFGLVCWWWWFDWSFARFTAPVVTTTSIILSSTEIKNGDVLLLANPGTPGKRPSKWRDRVMS